MESINMINANKVDAAERLLTMESINMINANKVVAAERRTYARNRIAMCREKYLKLPVKKALNPRLDSDLVKEREKLYKKRSERVKEVCERYKDARRGLNTHEGEEFIYDVKNRLAWCKTAKVSNCEPNQKMKDSVCMQFAVWILNMVEALCNFLWSG